jgi:hypothetical protein
MPLIRLSEGVYKRLQAIRGSAFDITIDELMNKAIALKECQSNLTDYTQRIENNKATLKKRIASIRIYPNIVINEDLKDSWIDRIMRAKLKKENFPEERD